MAPTPALIATCVAFALLAGCTVTNPPTTRSATLSPSAATSPQSQSASATPSPTWGADQAAAIAVADGYRAASDQIGANPAGFSEAEMKALLGQWAGPEVVKTNVSSYLALKKRGFRYDIASKVLSTTASQASVVGYGVEVVLTRCIDQSPARVLDKNGAQVSEAVLGYRVPQFLLRQYTLQKRTADKSFLVYGLASAKGECGPS